MLSQYILPTLRHILSTLFVRMLLIILIPLVLIQLITVLVFYERHWDTVTRYMATNLSADIATIVDRFTPDRSPDNLASVSEYAAHYFLIQAEWQQNSELPLNTPQAHSTYAGRQLTANLKERLTFPFRIDLDSSPDLISIFIGYPESVLKLTASRKRIFSSTSWLFIIWTFGTTVLLAIIATLFLRGQVRPIKRLAQAARQIGLGRPPLDYRATGAFEVRQAGRAFQAMYSRIQRQISERMEILAGVSHDLRTPLTRMKLTVAMADKSDLRQELEANITELESMIEGYLNFASGTISEDVKETDLVALTGNCIERDFGADSRIVFDAPSSPLPVLLRPVAIRRAISNLISNALNHGGNCFISIEAGEETVSVIIDDDGSGIPRDKRRAALKPFARNVGGGESGGIGLGLSIANEAAVSHGGELLLGDAPQGGLRARLRLPL